MMYAGVPSSYLGFLGLHGSCSLLNCRRLENWFGQLAGVFCRRRRGNLYHHAWRWLLFCFLLYVCMIRYLFLAFLVGGLVFRCIYFFTYIHVPRYAYSSRG